MTNPVIHALTANDPSDRPSPPTGCTWSAINAANSEEFPHGCITYHFDDPPIEQGEEQPASNWAEFRKAFLMAPATTLLRRAYPGEFACVMPSLVVEQPDPLVVAYLWNELMESVTANADDVAEWQAIANLYHIPFTFAPDGSLNNGI